MHIGAYMQNYIGGNMIHPKKLAWEAKFFSILGQPTRLKLIYLLKEGEKCVCEITPDMEEDQSVVSRHLNKLKNIGILECRKEGVSVYYWIVDSRIFHLLEIGNEMLRDHTLKQAREVHGSI